MIRQLVKILIHTVALFSFTGKNSFIHAQEWPAIHFGVKDGLSQNKCNGILKDERNFIWIGTRNGLNKFDGFNFSIFTKDQGLLHNRIHDIAPFKDGKILILTYEGISIYDGNNFLNFPREFHEVDFQLFTTVDGSVFIDGEASGIIKFLDEKYETVCPEIISKITRIIRDKQNGKLYILAGNKVYDLKTCKQLLELDFSIFNVINISDYTLFGHWGDRINIYFIEDGILKSLPLTSIPLIEKAKIEQSFQSSNGLQWSNSILIKNTRHFIYNQDSSIWLTADNGLFYIPNKTFDYIPEETAPEIWKVQQVENDLYLLEGFYSGLRLFNEDGSFQQNADWKTLACLGGTEKIQNDTFCIGTATGVYKYKNHKIQKHSNIIAFSIKYDRLSHRILYGTEKGVVIEEDGQLISLNENSKIHKNNYIQWISIDNKNQFYFFGSYEGISVCNIQSLECTNYTLEQGNLPSRGIFCSTTDNNGRLWLGGDNNLIFFDSLTTKFKLIESPYLHSMVKSMITFNERYLLLGLTDGLYLFDYKTFNDSEKTIVIPLNAYSGFHGDEPGFNCFFEDSKQRIWICSSTIVSRLQKNKLHLTPPNCSIYLSSILPTNESISDKSTSIKIPNNRDYIDFHISITCKKHIIPVYFRYKLDADVWSEWQLDSRLSLKNLSHGEHTLEIQCIFDNASGISNIIKQDFLVSIPIWKRTWMKYLAIGLVLVLVGLILFSFIREIRANRILTAQINRENYLKSQLLLAELKPHFIFNVLSSIYAKILKGNKSEAADAILRLSDLMRNFLKTTFRSNLPTDYQNDICLKEEIEMLKHYIEFEQQNSNNKFKYEIDINNNIDVEHVFIPPLLFQPIVENAIKHGIYLSKNEGLLKITFINNPHLIVIIEDNGVGRKDAINKNYQKYLNRESFGNRIVLERINTLNKLGQNILIKTVDLIPNGTKVTLEFIET